MVRIFGKFFERPSFISEIAREPVKREVLKALFGVQLVRYEVNQLVHRGGGAVHLIKVDLHDLILQVFLFCHQLLHDLAVPLRGAPEHVGLIESDVAFETV